MKCLYVNGELAGDAEKIFVDKQKKQITGYNGDSDTPAFALRGVKFDAITYEIKDEQGNPVEPDISEEAAEAAYLLDLDFRISMLELGVA